MPMIDIKEDFSPYKKDNSKANKRSFLSIYWKCCYTYTHIYKCPAGKTYKGQCPKCGSCIVVPIGNEGTEQRIFVAE